MKIFKYFTSAATILSPLIVIACNNKEHVVIDDAAKTKELSIKEIYDGDTVKFSDNIVGRLVGIDTAETTRYNDHSKLTTGEEWEFANKAKKFLIDLVKKTKKIEYKKITLDKYKRSVIHLILDGKDASKILVKNGLARIAYLSANPKNIYYLDEPNWIKDIKKIELEAKKNKIGIWNESKNLRLIFPKMFLK